MNASPGDPQLKKLSMRTAAIPSGGVCALFLSPLTFGSGPSARAAELLSYYKDIVGTETASPAEIGTKISCSSTRPCSRFIATPGRSSKTISFLSTRLFLDCFQGLAEASSFIGRGGRRSTRRPSERQQLCRQYFQLLL
jgi:hypothetical protein